MSGYPSVLIGTVTYSGKDYVWDEHNHAIQQIKYPNTSRLVVDNTRGTSYTQKLRRRGVNAVSVPRGEHSYEAIANGYTKLFNYASEHDFDYLLTVESDLLPERDVIDRLLLHDKKIVGSWYFLGMKNQYARMQPCIMVDVDKGSFVGSKLLGCRHTDEGKQLDMRVIRDWMNSGVRECHGAGFGCTLIKDDIFNEFDKIQYVPGDTPDGKSHADSWFYFQLRNNGIPVHVDTDRIVEHRPSSWDDVPDRYTRNN